MSYWCYVNGLINICVSGMSQDECDNEVSKILTSLPIPLNQQHDDNQSISVFVNKHDGFNCCSGGPDGFNSWQTCYSLTLHGNLRYTYFDEAMEQIMDMLDRIKKVCGIDFVLINIDGYDKLGFDHIIKTIDKKTWEERYNEHH